ncbi:MAG: hypothetical protein IJ379_02075 [Lachnospiraceae bacterium]|nr:hypothetical protein [Lachnospiraceae bacterium]
MLEEIGLFLGVLWEDWKPLLALLLIVAVAFIPAFILKKVLERLPLPQLPEGYSEEDKLLVCTDRTYAYCMFFEILALLGIGMIVLAVSGFIGLDIALGIFAFFVAILCFAGAAVFFLTAKNYVVIFYKDGIILRTMLGQLFYFRDHEVLGFHHMSGKNPSLYIKTPEKSLRVDSMGTNYQKAKSVVMVKYKTL